MKTRALLDWMKSPASENSGFKGTIDYSRENNGT